MTTKKGKLKIKKINHAKIYSFLISREENNALIITKLLKEFKMYYIIKKQNKIK